MKTLIVYATHHGCTEECANRLRQGLGGEADLVRLRGGYSGDLHAYERVLVGGSIHIGKVQGAVKRFCKEHLDLLLAKQLGLFLCCMAEGADAQKEFDDAFPEVLRRHARASGMFGGAFRFEKMNMLQRAMIRKISGLDKSVDKIRQEAIDEFVGQLGV
jgi:menaquinone-dependent protoporphyrinogen oxidase